MSVRHTPTPWLIDDDVFDEDEIEITSQDLLDNSMGAIAAIQVGTFNDDVEARKRADAEFIVRAVNAHDDLVAALRGLRSWMPPAGDDRLNADLKAADAALAKAAQS